MEVELQECLCPICCGVPHEDLRFVHQFEDRDPDWDYFPQEMYSEPEPVVERFFHPLMDIGFLDWLEDGVLDFFGMEADT
jgi:hypothetical protein